MGSEMWIRGRVKGTAASSADGPGKRAEGAGAVGGEFSPAAEDLDGAGAVGGEFSPAIVKMAEVIEFNRAVANTTELLLRDRGTVPRPPLLPI